VIVYAETSAVLRWLLGGEDADRVLSVLSAAERVVSSRLTIAEARRVVGRAVAEKALGAGPGARARAALDAEVGAWDVMELTEPVWIRAEDRFPIEPVRMLDAIHLATALRFQELVGRVALLSTDDRVLGNWRALGLAVALGGKD